MNTPTPVPILIVDDNPKNLMALESVLNAADYRLVLVQSAQDALQALLRWISPPSCSM